MVAHLPLSLAVAFLATSVLAQSGEYGQCGGNGWAGPVLCVSGWVCMYENLYYSQCLPETSSATSETSTTTILSSTHTSTSTSSSVTGTPTGTADVNYWFSFGDSYTQTGFLDNETLPNLSNPFGNPAYPGYTATGGSNWLDFLTTTYNTSVTLNYNYAYGGATINSSLVTPYEPTVLSVADQVAQFLSTAADKPASTPWTSANALFSVWIGINDLGNSYYESGDRTAFNSVLLTNLFQLVQDLYNVGARNFLFLNVPPTDRSPLMLAEGTTACALLKSVIEDFNAQYITYIADFEANNTGVKSFLWDANSFFELILNDPTAYGFLDSTSYGNTGDFWINTLHTTSPANQLYAQNISSTLLDGAIW